MVVPGPARASCGPAARKGSGQTRGGGGQQGSSCSGSHSLPPLALGPQLKGKSFLLPSSPGQEAGFRRQSPGLQAGHCLLGAPAGNKGEMGSAPCWRESCSSPRAPITIRGCQGLRTRALKAFCKCSRHRRCLGPPRGGFARGSGPRPLCVCDLHHGPGALPLLAPAVRGASGGALPEGARPLDSAPRAPHHRGQDRDREGRRASRQVRTDPFPDCHLCARYFTTGATWAGRRGKEMGDQQQPWEGALPSC